MKFMRILFRIDGLEKRKAKFVKKNYSIFRKIYLLDIEYPSLMHF